MTEWIQWLAQNWHSVVIPLLVFLASAIVGLWLRRVAYDAFNRWTSRTKWEGSRLVIQVTRSPFLHWFFLLGAYIAVQVSVLPSEASDIAGKIIASLFILSIFVVAINLGEKLTRLYLVKLKAPPPPTRLIVNIIRIALIVVSILIILDVWGLPTTPIILVLAVAILIVIFALRDTLPNLFSGAQMAWNEQIKVGDFIKVESGETGYVTAINWRNTEMRTLEGNSIVIPNSSLVRTKVLKYARPLKKAASPFRFYTRLHLMELTGLRATNLRELANTLRDAPDAVIYYHTHNFLERHHYLTPEPANDFALWIADALGNEVLGERLASIDVFDYPTLGALKMRFVDIIEDYLAKNPDGRQAPSGEEIHFIRSISIILPTPYVAYDLREFIEVMNKITVDSIYFHIFEARLRLKKVSNDFSVWLEESLEEKELADKIAHLDPYTYTLESLRTAIIQLTEKWIK